MIQSRNTTQFLNTLFFLKEPNTWQKIIFCNMFLLTIDFVRSGLTEIGGGGESSSCSELVAISVGVLLGLLLLTLSKEKF